MTTIKFKKLNIEAYKPGKSSIRRLKKIIKLSANESALGVSKRVKKIISNKNLNLYKRFQELFDERNKILLDAQKKECELLLLNNR